MVGQFSTCELCVFRLCCIRPTCTWFLFFTRFLTVLSKRSLDKWHFTNFHVSYNREAETCRINLSVTLISLSVYQNAPGPFYCAFHRKTGVPEHHLRWNSFLCPLLYMKENGSNSKSSFWAVLDVILSTSQKEGNGYTEFKKTFF